MKNREFTEMLLSRTKNLAIDVIRLVDTFPKCTSYFVIGKQIVKSASSTAANYRATMRGRSDREFFSKLSIVVEECDETLFWLEMLRDSNLVEEVKLLDLINEAEELLKVLAKSRKTMKLKMSSSNNSKSH